MNTYFKKMTSLSELKRIGSLGAKGIKSDVQKGTWARDDPLTKRVTKALITLNELGVFTVDSQTGTKKPKTHQRAYLTGFIDEKRFQHLVENIDGKTELIVVGKPAIDPDDKTRLKLVLTRTVKNGKMIPYTFFNGLTPNYDLEGYLEALFDPQGQYEQTKDHPQRPEVKLLKTWAYKKRPPKNLYLFTVIDPKWGRPDYLFKSLIKCVKSYERITRKTKRQRVM